MKYNTYLKEVFANVLMLDKRSGNYFINPAWRYLLKIMHLEPSCVTDYKMNMTELKEILELELYKRNNAQNQINLMFDYLYDLVLNKVEVPIGGMKTEYLKDVTEYLKQKNANIKHEQEVKDDKEKIDEMLGGVSVAKRKVE